MSRAAPGRVAERFRLHNLPEIHVGQPAVNFVEENLLAAGGLKFAPNNVVLHVGPRCHRAAEQRVRKKIN